MLALIVVCQSCIQDWEGTTAYFAQFSTFRSEILRNCFSLFVTTTIKRNLAGDMEYVSNDQRASLKKDLFNNGNYSDSSGNKFEFSNSSWQLLSDLHGNEEKVLLFLIGNFLP